MKIHRVAGTFRKARKIVGVPADRKTAMKVIKHGSRATQRPVDEEPYMPGKRPVMSTQAAISFELAASYEAPEEATVSTLILSTENDRETKYQTESAPIQALLDPSGPAYKPSKAADLRPMKQSAKIAPRTSDTDAVTVRDLARELDMRPKDLLDLLLSAHGEFVSSVHAKVAAPLVRELREAKAERENVAVRRLAQIAVEDMHHSTPIEGRSGDNCSMFACSCGTKWVAHTLFVGCELHNAAVAVFGCPVKAAELHLINSDVLFERLIAQEADEYALAH